MITTTLISSCHWKTLVAFCSRKKRLESAFLTLTLNYLNNLSLSFQYNLILLIWILQSDYSIKKKKTYIHESVFDRFIKPDSNSLNRID